MSDQRERWQARAAECQQTAASAIEAAETADSGELRAHFLLLAQEALKLAQEIEALLTKL